jgi:VWFA-related protein
MARLLHACCCAAFAAALTTTVSGQNSPSPASGGQLTFRSASSLVALNVTVQDAQSRYVTGLQPDDFAVYEDGVRQEVEFFECADLPIDLILLLDRSASMLSKMRTVREAARGFVRTLRDTDRGAVVAFNQGVAVSQALTSDRKALERSIDTTEAGGLTALHSALYISLKQFGQAAVTAGEIRRQAIAILSDGEDTASLVSFEDVLATARGAGVNIYTVRLQSRDALAGLIGGPSAALASAGDYEMKTLAKETGALSFFPKPEQLAGVYSSIAQELANQYSIGYVPLNRAPDGRFRHVSVQVVTRPGLKARTRLGYTARF